MAAGAIAAGQPFGRFGSASDIDIPGFEVDKTGFRAKAASAERFRFASPSAQWQPVETSDRAQIIALTGAGGGPSKLKVDLAAPTFALYFPAGLSLRVAGATSPILTWSEGSVGDGVPTPDLSWAIVSFREAQPPVLLVLEGPPQSLKFEGQPGDWVLRSSSDAATWVRIGLPAGLKPMATANAASLGAMVQEFEREKQVWLQEWPKLLDAKADADGLAVTLTLSFDRPGAVVPTPVLLATLGGYPLTSSTRVRRLSAVLETGPISVTEEQTLVVRLPARRVPTGRFLAVGSRPAPTTSAVSPTSIASVVRLAFRCLGSDREPGALSVAQQLMLSYAAVARAERVPSTGLEVPYAMTGEGLDLAAGQALLAQSLTSTTQSTSISNTLLTQALAPRDWLTWRLWARDDETSRRAGALAAIAAALCPEPERRLEGAMLQAGLAAERGLNVFRRRSGVVAVEPKLLEPLFDVRRELFGMPGKGSGDDAFARAMLSEVRVYGETAIALERRGDALYLVWFSPDTRQGVLTLASAYPIVVERGTNLAGFEPTSSLGFTTIRFRAQAPGVCEAKLILPAWARPLPAASPTPAYSEVTR